MQLRFHAGDINWRDFYDEEPTDSIDTMNKAHLVELQNLKDYFEVDEEQLIQMKNKLKPQH